MRDDCTGIEGIDTEEAEALIGALADHIVKPQFIYRHQWRPGDLLMWDNCTVQHRAIQDYDMPAAPPDASHDDGRRGTGLNWELRFPFSAAPVCKPLNGRLVGMSPMGQKAVSRAEGPTYAARQGYGL